MESLTTEVVAVAFAVAIEAWERRYQEVEQTLLERESHFISSLEQHSPDTVEAIKKALKPPFSDCAAALKQIVQQVERFALDNCQVQENMSKLKEGNTPEIKPKLPILCLLMCHGNLDRWFEAMNLSIEGKATLLNISHDWQQGRILESVISELLRRSENYFNLNQTPSNQIPETTGEGDVRQTKSNSRCSDSLGLEILKDIIKNLEVCQGPEIKPLDQDTCSRVMDLKSFIKHNLDVKPFGLEIHGQDRTEEEIQFLQQADLAERGMGKMETKRPFAWVTKTQFLEEINQKTNSDSQNASTVRNRLGLIDIENQQLIEIKYSQEIMQKCKLAMPTFIEGCPSRIYRSKSPNQDDQWGRTVNLETYEEDLPEAVHPSVDFGRGFSWQYLGKVEEPSPPYQKELFFKNFSTGFTRDVFLELISNL